ncbi:hypothetical protein [Paenibacillus cremeus]|uniref:Uncharacterized protein n=1 Tax=Paenibacillus cremeus TaxID=2163881 RepID=A0A559KI73_9BACL|nr:hypothetical protein [Paenibacillus cremeus]TVY11840.1 hypothetical protein FPZ49_00665 [Paenibacillus cremeus]
MSWQEQENRTKLHILNSLARSQRALARIMESIADVVEGTEPTAQKLAEHIEAISKYQRQLSSKMMGIRLRRKTYGRVTMKPWIHPMVRRKPKQPL